MTMTSKPEYVYVTYIQSTPEKVWNALFDKELSKLYWGMGKNVSDWKTGSKWEHRDYETEEVKVSGEVLEIDAPKRLVLTWNKPNLNEPGAKLTVLVENTFGAVKLTVIHEQLSQKMYEGVSQGWPAILSSLKTLLESGQPMPMTTRRWG